jgi:hypothetical protein
MLTLAQYFFQHRIEIQMNIIIQEANDVNPFTNKTLGTRSIVSSLRCMRSSIRLDDQFSFMTIEVCHERRLRMLPAEFKSAELAITKTFPKFGFS